MKRTLRFNGPIPWLGRRVVPASTRLKGSSK